MHTTYTPLAYNDVLKLLCFESTYKSNNLKLCRFDYRKYDSALIGLPISMKSAWLACSGTISGGVGRRGWGRGGTGGGRRWRGRSLINGSDRSPAPCPTRH